jgi:hypothetical protein
MQPAPCALRIVVTLRCVLHLVHLAPASAASLNLPLLVLLLLLLLLQWQPFGLTRAEVVHVMNKAPASAVEVHRAPN